MSRQSESTVNKTDYSAHKNAVMAGMNMIITKHEILDSHGAIRFGSYLTIWLSYLTFMSSHSPRGIDWLSWQLQRIYNTVEYVKVNGYFSSYGFSIWSTCQDCGFSVSEWIGKIYLSFSVFIQFPYILLNHFGGFNALKIYGTQIDKALVFLAAAAAAELIIICIHNYSTLPKYFVGIVCVMLFTTAPWTYKMLLTPWPEIYFLSFFLFGLLFFAYERKKAGLLMLFIASLFHYQ